MRRFQWLASILAILCALAWMGCGDDDDDDDDESKMLEEASSTVDTVGTGAVGATDGTNVTNTTLWGKPVLIVWAYKSTLSLPGFKGGSLFLVIGSTTGDVLPGGKLVSASVGGDKVDINSNTFFDFDEDLRTLEIAIFFRDPVTIKPGVKISFTITNDEMGDDRVSLTL